MDADPAGGNAQPRVESAWERFCWRVAGRPDEDEWWKRWRGRWIFVNALLATGAFVAFELFVGYLHFVHSFSAQGVVAIGIPVLVVAVVVAVPLKLHVVLVWAAAGTVFFALVSSNALNDARQFYFTNCWKIRGTDQSSTWECAPGRSAPYQLDVGNTCDYLSTSSSRGTLWHCYPEY